ncbi:hypothetical protein [Halomicrococcus sp. NG-SE-24]|uniref:hypothetical protein n=1 Tax=unclassified Halomicrococcus TaxID=2614448 RepID=UPI000DE11322|nr:hypothetical protein DMJ13_16055 [halophilic archaeon]
MVPLFGPVPGGMELIVILLVAVMMFGLPLTVFGGFYLVYRRSKTDEAEELEALREEVAALRDQLDERDE